MMYDRNMDAMKLAMRNIECEKHSRMTFADEDGQEHMWSFKSNVDSRGVVPVKRGL